MSENSSTCILVLFRTNPNHGIEIGTITALDWILAGKQILSGIGIAKVDEVGTSLCVIGRCVGVVF